MWIAQKGQKTSTRIKERGGGEIPKIMTGGLKVRIVVLRVKPGTNPKDREEGFSLKIQDILATSPMRLPEAKRIRQRGFWDRGRNEAVSRASKMAHLRKRKEAVQWQVGHRLCPERRLEIEGAPQKEVGGEGPDVHATEEENGVVKGTPVGGNSPVLCVICEEEEITDQTHAAFRSENSIRNVTHREEWHEFVPDRLLLTGDRNLVS